MAYYYSASTEGFYDSDLGGVIPNDAIALTYEEYVFFRDAPSRNEKVVVDVTGSLKSVPSYNLNDEKALLLESVYLWRKKQESSESTFIYNDRPWDVGVSTLNRLKPCIELCQRGELPSGFFWTDANNEDFPMSPTQLNMFYNAMLKEYVTRGFAIHARQREMKQEISRLGTPEQVSSYRIGW